MSRKKIYRILIEAIVAAVLIFVLVFVLGFRVRTVQIEGNKFYSDEEIRKMVLDAPMAKNSILAMMIKTEQKTKDAQMIDRVTIKRKNRNTLVVQVKEKQMIGYFELNGKCINFDRQGIVWVITEEPLDGVPLIEGLDAKEVKQGEKLKGISTRKLNTILSVGKMLEKAETKPDRMVLNDMKQLVLYYGDVEVRLGDDENMDEKMNRLMGILPHLEGMEGILHLENVTEDTDSIVFDKEAEEEEGQEDQTQDGEEDSQERGDSNTQEDQSSDGLEITDGSESSDGRLSGEDSDSQGGDLQEDTDTSGNTGGRRSTRDSGDYEEEEDDSDLEYSDGSDSR